jgi:hypothetical protein
MGKLVNVGRLLSNQQAKRDEDRLQRLLQGLTTLRDWPGIYHSVVKPGGIIVKN